MDGDSPSMMTEQPIRASAVAAPLVMIRLGKIPRRYVFDQVETMALHDIDGLNRASSPAPCAHYNPGKS
ncbi:hypothetical protein SB4_10815 [Sphingomonas sanguinis]|uniref:Uncharacterized protein n=2 Tax=Sphingomonas sanguinis TaxID=33051 RepID=A0A147ISV3_9SPHN|nr:hypothetical protein SB4_10815 [Sphingomonas sanguinis]